MGESEPTVGSRALPFCIATCVSGEALAGLLEVGAAGTYHAEHPWLMAHMLLEQARERGLALPLLIASEPPLALSHWALIERIDVVELHRGRCETACNFSRMQPINPIWHELDSVLLKPGDDQLRREQLESLRLPRYPLDARQIRPYAICETPAFIMAPPVPETGNELERSTEKESGKT